MIKESFSKIPEVMRWGLLWTIIQFFVFFIWGSVDNSLFTELNGLGVFFTLTLVSVFLTIVCVVLSNLHQEKSLSRKVFEPIFAAIIAFAMIMLSWIITAPLAHLVTG